MEKINLYTLDWVYLKKVFILSLILLLLIFLSTDFYLFVELSFSYLLIIGLYHDSRIKINRKNWYTGKNQDVEMRPLGQLKADDTGSIPFDKRSEITSIAIKTPLKESTSEVGFSEVDSFKIIRD